MQAFLCTFTWTLKAEVQQPSSRTAASKPGLCWLIVHRVPDEDPHCEPGAGLLELRC